MPGPFTSTSVPCPHVPHYRPYIFDVQFSVRIFHHIQFERDKNQKNSPEAIQKRLQRKAKRVGAAAVRHVKSHRRKESLTEKLLLGPHLSDDDLDIASKDVE